MEDWRKPLKEEAKSFFLLTVVPAFEELKTKLERRGKEVKIEDEKEDSALITVLSGGEEWLYYTIITRIYPPTDDFPSGHVCPYVEWKARHKRHSGRYGNKRYFWKEKCNYNVSSVSKEKIIEHFFETFRIQLQ